MMKSTLRQYWDLISLHLRAQWKKFSLLTMMLLSSILLQLLNPQIMRSFIDAALGSGSDRLLLLTAGAFIGIALLRQIFAISVTYLGETVAWVATNALRAELAWHCLNLDMSFHNLHTPGELIERIDGDVSELANFFSTLVVTVIGNTLLLFGILGALYLEDLSAGLAFTAFSFTALVALSRVRDLAVPSQVKRRQAEAELFGFIEEQLSSTEDIRSSGAVDFSLRSLHYYQAEVLKYDLKAHSKNWIIHIAMGCSLTLGNILAVVTGYLLYSSGVISIGTVYMLVFYMNLLEAPIWALTRQVESFQTIGACVQRLSELRTLQPKIHGGHLIDFPSESLALRFDNVSFAYNQSEPILHELSFALKPGRVLGLLGRTGSGKTTLSRMVLRLYDPVRGRISINEVDLRELQLHALRQRIAVVTQDVQLFQATVRDNLTFFDQSISDEKIINALNTLEMGDWYKALPKGLDTMIESGGRGLSAGEAQLLAFTRVLLRNPGIVILDEASSRLDPATEQRIELAIDKLLHQRTAIIIAHRLETVYRADEILIIEAGKTLEYGPRDQLAADPNSTFYKLLQTGLQEVLA